MRKLFYCGLEPYNARYTLQLTDWNTRVFERRNIDYEIVHGETLDTEQEIVTGQVLDAHGRSYYALSQMMNLVRLLREGKITGEDVIFFEDMFHPGIESLPYIFDQIDCSMRPKVFIRCLAQTIDPDDFVHVWGMKQWMMKYEQMVDNFVYGILASSEEMVAHIKIAGWDSLVYNISGLAFSKDEVHQRLLNTGERIKTFDERKMRVAFSSRWDQEKQPEFYMDLIEAWHERYPDSGIEFAVFSGAKLKSNDDSYMSRTRALHKEGKMNIYENLSKEEYYRLLNDTRVVFNCALQDWVSNTVSEADALGCNVLFPAYRSFPETFSNDHQRMYVPWSIDDAIQKLHNLLSVQHPNLGKISDHTSGTVDRICDILEGKGQHMLRTRVDYRKHTRESKF